jgi:spermidine synthase
MPDKPGIGKTAVFIFFFGSGFSALLYQIVWLKYLNLLLGSTTYASVAVLSAFMFGLSVGSRLAPRLSFLYRTSLRSYGILEMGVGIFAILFPSIYSWMKIPFGAAFNLVGPETVLYNFVAFFIAFLVLLLPTSLMGATLPLLAHYVIQKNEISRYAGYLYAVNTTGAVLGILVSAFVLIPTLGLNSTVYVGVVINLVVGLICFLAGKVESALEPPKTAATPRREPLLYYYAVSGFLALGYEVLWTRILVLHLGSSVYAYAIMLANFLLGISLGSFLCGKWISRRDDQLEWLFGCIQILWALSILLQIYQFTHFGDVLYSFAKSFGSLGASSHFLTLFAGAFQILFLPTFLSGALFPLVVYKLSKSGFEIREAISLSYSYNTIGGILGSVVIGFLLIPIFGTQVSLLLLAAGNLLLGLLSLYPSPVFSRGLRTAVLLALFLGFIGAAVVIDHRFHILQSAGIFQMDKGEELLSLEEDVSATISVEKRMYMGEPYRSISVNGVNVAGTSPNLVAIQKMQAHIPMILYGPSRQKKVLHIGFGSGGTAYSVSLYPHTEVTVVELSRAIVRNADAYFPSVNHGIVRSNQFHFIYFDGRSFLQNTQRKFDVILSDSIHPRYSGNGSLYTKDYYELVFQRLNDGGVHSQWLPLYSLTTKNFNEILRAFSDVFPDTYVWYINSTLNPYVIITGQKNGSRIDLNSIQEAMSIPAVRSDLNEIDITNEYSLMDYFLFGRKEVASLVSEANPHEDDRMTVEYESSRVVQRELSWLYNFKDVLAQRTSILPYARQIPDWFQAQIFERYYEATAFNLQGQIFFLEGKPQDAKKAFLEARNRNGADHDPYEFEHVRF